MGSIFSRIDLATQPAKTAVFGESITFRPKAGGEFSVTVNWREDETIRGRNGIQASAFGQLAEFPVEPVKNDLIDRGGRTYVIAENPIDGKDGFGAVMLYLRLA